MARPIVLSNGSLFVGLSEHGLVHDFYFPYVGLDNLTNARHLDHKIGVWVDEEFSWIGNDDWVCNADFEADALIGHIGLESSRLQVRIATEDVVLRSHDAFVRKIEVTNLADRPRQIRIFLHQAFEISRAGRADTALYVPDEHYIYDYKGSVGLLIHGRSADGTPFDQFSIGNCGIEGKEGTWRDAEDGELSGNAVEHGGVDSVLRFKLECEAGSTQTLYYWIAAAHSQNDAEAIHKHIQHITPDRLIENTRRHWHEWLSIAANKIHPVEKNYLDELKKSLLIIAAHCDKNGGILASGDSSIYNYGRDYYSYVWPRDGAYAMWPLIRLGYRDEPKRFFEFCRQILHKDGYLMHKYQPDKSVGSTWHPLLHKDHTELAIQEDETAIIIYMLGEYYAHSKDDEFVEQMYEPLIQPMTNFLCRFIDESTGLPHASYDLWEEKFLTTTYTTATVYQALVVASELAEVFDFADDKERWSTRANRIHESSTVFVAPDNTFRKGFLLDSNGDLAFDDCLDASSLYGTMMYGLYDKSQAEALHNTARSIIAKLSVPLPTGGVARHENDHYFLAKTQYPGNPWAVTTLWLAQYYLRIQKPDEARRLIEWVMSHALPSGALSEQLDPENGEPLSVTPLVWSHAEFINTVLDLSHIQ